MNTELGEYIPGENHSHPIELREDLLPNIQRISNILPDPKIWQYYSSSPSETSGKIVFPYWRCDAALQVCDDRLLLSQSPKDIPIEKRLGNYLIAANFALATILWIDIGFNGIENLAHHPASKNWTSGVGHSVTDEQRAQSILTNGNGWYIPTIKHLIQIRKSLNIKEDPFTLTNAEFLLDKFK